MYLGSIYLNLCVHYGVHGASDMTTHIHTTYACHRVPIVYLLSVFFVLLVCQHYLYSLFISLLRPLNSNNQMVVSKSSRILVPPLMWWCYTPSIWSIVMMAVAAVLTPLSHPLSLTLYPAFAFFYIPRTQVGGYEERLQELLGPSPNSYLGLELSTL